MLVSASLVVCEGIGRVAVWGMSQVPPQRQIWLCLAPACVGDPSTDIDRRTISELSDVWSRLRLELEYRGVDS